MQLSMRRLSMGEPAEDLPEDDPVMCTGPMGDCVCVVVLWDHNPQTNTFDRVRGYHGLGGFLEINLDSLFDDVPPGPGTAIYGFFGNVAASSPDHRRFAEAIATHFPEAYTATYDTPEARVYRDGSIEHA
jgi:hypothetical protein